MERAGPAVARNSHCVLVASNKKRAGGNLSLRARESRMPLQIKKTKKNLYFTDFENSSHVLIDVTRNYVHGECFYEYYGSLVEVFAINVGTYSYIYYKNDQMLKPMSRNILGILSRHFLGDNDYYYNDVCGISNVIKMDKTFTQRKAMTLREAIDLPMAKITGDHHTHFTVAEVLRSLDGSEKKKAIHALTIGGEIHNGFMAGVMLWLSQLDEIELTWVLKSSILHAPDPVSFMKAGKEISVRAKSYQNIVYHDLRKLFEIDVLVNRGYGKVDWQQEYNNRTSPQLAKVSYKQIYKQSFNLFKRYDSGASKPRKLDWKTFWGSRWQWTATGSTHTQYEQDKKYISKDRKLSNKFVSFIKMPEFDFDYFYSRKPEIQAWSSIKYEWGKQRAIYGTDITSYVLAHYAFYNCEDCLPNDFPVGKKATPQRVKGRVRAVLEDNIPYCIDFEDFNSQHSNDNMAAVIHAYINAYRRHLSHDQIKAAEWTAESIYSTTINDNMGLKKVYKSNGTLMSGWRLTTFINSILNYLYSKILLSKRTTVYRSVHNGDDVLVGTDNFALTTNVLKTARHFGIRLQRSKCAFGGIAEFLRVDHVRGMHGQYLTRNVATLIHSRIESTLATDVRDAVEAMEDRLGEFESRGGNINTAARLRETYYKHLSQVFNLTVDELYIVKMSHKVVGGVSKRQNALVKYLIEAHVRGKTTTEELPGIDEMPGIHSYADQVAKTLNIEDKKTKVAERILKATHKALRYTRNNVKVVVNNNVERYQRYRSLYKAHSDKSDQTLGKAMMTGFAFDTISEINKYGPLRCILKSSQDPIKMLDIVV